MESDQRLDGLTPSGWLPDAYDLAPLANAIEVEVLSAHLTDVMLNEVYSEVTDPELLRSLLARATLEKLETLAQLARRTITLDEVTAQAALAFAAEVGRQGISEQILERSYRIGTEALWNSWMAIVERHCARTGDPVADVVRASIPILFGFVDRMLFVSLASYHEAVAQRHQTIEYRRIRLVEQLLDGTLAEPGTSAEALLGYTFARHHLAAVLDAGESADNQRLADELKRACHAADLLLLERRGAPTELWLGLRSQMTGSMRAALEARTVSTGRRIAFGDVAPGLDGFRASIATARDAARIQTMLSNDAPQVLWADDVRVEMLALHNPAGARALVRSMLGTALERGLLTGRVRETLDAWLVSGSYVGAASVLGVHEQTVRQRLRRLEDALGRSLHDRRTELHVALRLSLLTLPTDLPGNGHTGAAHVADTGLVWLA